MRKRSIKQMFAASVSLVFGTLIVFAVFGTSSCKKEVTTDSAVEIESSYNDAMLEHILDFKSKMEYYYKNPELKSGASLLQIDSTILDWEATINLTYCYSYQNLSDMIVYDTILDIPLINGDSITVAKASEKYFNNILYSIQDKYFDAEFIQKKLISVDLEPVNEGDSLHISIVIGNDVVPALPTGDWKYGDDLGQCDDGLYAPLDAADILAMDVRNYFQSQPPANCRYYFTNILTETEDNPLLYPNMDDTPHWPNNSNIIDNYCDYLIYYAVDNVVPYNIPEVFCVENEDEEVYYRLSYINFTQGYLDNAPTFPEGKMKYQTSTYFGYLDYQYGHYCVKHVLNTTLGRRFLVCNLAVADISNY